MKQIIALLAVLAALPAMAQPDRPDRPGGPGKEEGEDSIVFTTIIENPITSVKNQNSSGTCWDYSALAYLESEVLKKHPEMKDIDLCESFVANKTYLDRADKNVRTHGDASFDQGGSFYDVIYCMTNYGLIPEGLMPYPVTLYGDSLYSFSSFFPPMKAYVEAISKSEARKINPAWKKSVQSMLDNYFGECPTEFVYQGKTFTPQEFVKYLDLDPNDYVSLTSYTHHPFYTTFILEIQDNWRCEESYNLPLDEFMRVMEECVKNGWTFAWGADVSEEGFRRRAGKNGCIVTVPKASTTKRVGSDQSRWTGEREGAQVSISDIEDEMEITQELRQEGYDNWETTDDHGMQIFGLAKDQFGKEFFMMKNSWGENGPYDGIWYVSKPYVAYKTMNILVNKNAIPKDIRKKLGI